MNKVNKNNLDENLIFIGAIYDSFDALEETLGKLKLERPLFLTHVAKLAFAEEVFQHVEGIPDYCRLNFNSKDKENLEHKQLN